MAADNYSDDREQASRSHLRRIAQAHKQCRTALAKIETSSVPPDQASVDPDDTDNLLVKAHAAALDYWGEIAPYAEDIKTRTEGDITYGDPETGEQSFNLWTEPLYQANVPDADDATDAGDGDAATRINDYYERMGQNHAQLDGIDFSDAPPEYRPVTVTLASLPSWRQWMVAYTKTKRVPGRGRVTRSFRKRVVIPPAGVGEVFDQLNTCLRELGKLAEVEEQTPRTEITEDLIRDVEEWRQENIDE